MKNFTNEYEIDDNYIKEMSTEWTKRVFISKYLLMEDAILFLLGLILVIMNVNENVSKIGFLSMFFVLVTIIAYLSNVKNAVKNTKDRIRLISKDSTSPVQHIELANGQCLITRKDSTDVKNINLSEVVDHFETKNYFYLVFSGMVIASFSKTGFIEGDSTQFADFLKSFPTKKYIRPIILIVLSSLLVAINLIVLFLWLQVLL